MKFLKVAVMSAIALAWSSAYAFHSGGVAECEGCHTMHNSHEGEVMRTGSAIGDPSGIYLLKATDQSGTCLNCHGAGSALNGYHISTQDLSTVANIPQQLTPGGDFSWLKITTTFTVRGTQNIGKGQRRGHNVVAADFGYVADPDLSTAPGGSYPAANLSCISCHDPHGESRRFADGTYASTGLPIANSGSYNSSADPVAGIYAVGAYRILGGTGYEPVSTPGYAFGNQVPSTVAPSSYNRLEGNTKAGQTFVAYGQGMSEWCGNCHTAFIQSGYTSGMAGLRHPAGNGSALTAAVASNYNAYVTSGIMTNTDANMAYSTLTPFEVGTNDFSVLKPRANLVASDRSANTTNNVACVTCHRAHAGGFESMLRFFYLNEFMTIGDAAGVASYETNTTTSPRSQGLTPEQQKQAYYGRDASVFGPWARLQCNKCHAQD
jgi:hypothetical protein